MNLQAFALWMPGTGHVLHSSGFQGKGGDVELSNRHSSRERPRK